MRKDQYVVYQSFRQEFEALRESGLELCCPPGREVSPTSLAKRIAGDDRATYMRETICDTEGRAIRINFVRVRL